jgi:hypothetical protein
LWWEWKIWMRLVQRKNQSLTEQRPQQRHSASLIFIKSVPHVQLLQRIQHAKQWKKPRTRMSRIWISFLLCLTWKRTMNRIM